MAILSAAFLGRIEPVSFKRMSCSPMNEQMDAHEGQAEDQTCDNDFLLRGRKLMVVSSSSSNLRLAAGILLKRIQTQFDKIPDESILES